MNVFISIIQELVESSGDRTLQRVSAELQAWKEKYPYSYRKAMQSVDPLRAAIIESIKDEVAYRTQSMED